MRGEERRGWRKINRRRYPSGRRGGGKSGGDEDWSHTERLVVNAFVIRCKSRRFVVSPLTAAEKHENRRCTRRNTIIRPVNKFPAWFNPRRNRVVRQISRYRFLASIQILRFLALRFAEPILLCDHSFRGLRSVSEIRERFLGKQEASSNFRDIIS